MIYLENEIASETDFDLERTASSVINHVLECENCPFETEVSILITDNENIQKINKQFREIDKITDVLSFPNSNFKSPGDFSSFLDFTDCDAFNQDNGCFILGDIMLSWDRICSQAEDYGHSIKREYAFLIAHSVLHLIGYDHMTEEDARTMEQKQEKYLHELMISRD